MNDADYTRWIVEAERNFNIARRYAFLEDAVGLLLGRSKDLLSFDEVKRELGLFSSRDRGVSEIPLDKIVGSVGRVREFTRSFWPRREEFRKRWQRVYTFVHSSSGLPPIEVYQVGDIYFVSDGHHRVSVARQMGLDVIQARITEFVSPLRLTADVRETRLGEWA